MRRIFAKRGQAAVELALSAPVLVLLIVGSADVGRVFYYSSAIEYAAREGARHGAYFDPYSGSNAYANHTSIYNTVVAADPFLGSTVLTEPTVPGTAGSNGTLNCPTYPYANSFYPTTGNTGYVYICFNNNPGNTTSSEGQPIRVTILYNFQPVTSFLVSSVHTAASAEFYVEGLQ